MGAFDLINELRGAGVVVRADAGTLDISPADRLTDEMIDALKRHKPEILSLLQKEDAQLFGNIEQVKIVADRQEWKPEKCGCCKNVSRFVGGNACRVRNGQAWLFGFLYDVPEDQGATCIHFDSAYLH